jgi:hypothetical protein
MYAETTRGLETPARETASTLIKEYPIAPAKGSIRIRGETA